MSKIFSLLLLVLLSYLQACSSFYYHPQKLHYSNPQIHFKKNYIENIITSGENLLNTWLIPAKGQKEKKLIVQFHGNAENMSTHYYSLLWLTDFEFSLLTFDYSGYGKSSGTPNPKQLRQDGISILDYALKLFQEGGYSKLIVIGQSIGGAVAADALAHWKGKDKVNLFVIESSFSSYSRMAMDLLQRSWITYLFSPLGYLIVDTQTNPDKSLAQLTIPKLVIHGKNDPVIPLGEGRKLFEKLPFPKTLHLIEKGEHIDSFFTENQKYRNKFLDFIRKL